MAEETTGERTEKATPRRLRDARRRGDIAKSRDLGSAIGLAAVLLVLLGLVGIVPERLAALLDGALAFGNAPFGTSARSVGAAAVELLVLATAIVLMPIAAVGLLVEFLQAGPVLTVEKLVPKLSNLDPVAGMKRLFGADNLVELLKSTVQAALLFGIAGWVVLDNLPQIFALLAGEPVALAEAMLQLGIRLIGWTVAAFLLVTSVDLVWQRHSFAKKMRMSKQEVRDEHKRNEGDPMLRGKRRQMARQWSRESAKGAAAKASVLVVNPTHVAVAVHYDREACPVPTVTARGEEDLAQEMRDAAERAEVPVLRNERLARTLLADTSDGDLVPQELFAIVADVVLWALRVRERIDAERRGEPVEATRAALPAPGEDLTRYPGASDLATGIR